MRKTSVYLADEQVARLNRLSRAEGRPQAAIIRDAISSYDPATKADRDFELAKARAPRTDEDPRPISEIPDEELLRGFGGDSLAR
jgi:predicted DNA-binding protein